MQVKVKIDKQAIDEGMKLVRSAIAIVDRQENEFLIPYLRNEIDGEMTIDKLIEAKIKRVTNPNTMQTWYEKDGQVITPPFIRDLAGAFEGEEGINNEL
jgi:hypothetical protein